MNEIKPANTKKSWLDPTIETLATCHTLSGGGEYEDGDIAKGPDPGS